MLWVKAFHIVAVVAWFVGLTFLPRLLFVHAKGVDDATAEHLKSLERRLYWGLATPGAVISVLLGAWMLVAYAWGNFHQAGWLHTKLLLGFFAILLHVWLGRGVMRLGSGAKVGSAGKFKAATHVATLLLVLMTVLAVVKPF